jgi:hypothetical protein
MGEMKSIYGQLCSHPLMCRQTLVFLAFSARNHCQMKIIKLVRYFLWLKLVSLCVWGGQFVSDW